MSIVNFLNKFPNEQKCKDHFKSYRLQQGITCKKCGGKDHKWIVAKEQFECKNTACRFRTTLKSGTMLENTKLPYRHWFIAMWYVSSVKKSFSALEMQRQIGHRYYEPIWAMLHKIRTVMGNRDAQYTLTGEVEMDEGFFETVMVKEERDALKKQGVEPKQKRGRGSDKQAKALIMVESEKVQVPVKNKKGELKYRIQRKVKFLKMNRIETLQGAEIGNEVEKNIGKETVLSTDNSTSYSKLKDLVKQHIPKVVNKDDVIDHLPWVHTIISNAKRDFLSRHHSVSKKYFQLYLNEFCYKFNRRYMDMFDRLMVAGVSESWCK